MKTAIKLVFIYYGMQILGMMLAAIPCILLIVVTGGNIDNAPSMMLVPSLLIAIFLMTLYLWMTGYISREKSAWSAVSPAYLLLTVILTLSAIWLLDLLMSHVKLPDIMADSFDIMQSGSLGIFGIAIAGPILEELLFRGAITKVLLQKYSPVKAIIISALIFGIFHLNPAQILAAFLIGLLLAWVYYKTGSLIPCILIHIINNSLSVYLGANYPDAESFAALVGGNYYLVITVAAAVLLICSILIMGSMTIGPKWKTEKTEVVN